MWPKVAEIHPNWRVVVEAGYLLGRKYRHDSRMPRGWPLMQGLPFPLSFLEKLISLALVRKCQLDSVCTSAQQGLLCCDFQLRAWVRSLGLYLLLEPHSPTGLCKHLWEIDSMDRFSKRSCMCKVLGSWCPLLGKQWYHIVGSLSVSVIRKTQIK